MKKIILIFLISSICKLQSETGTNFLYLTIQPTNATYILGEPMWVKAIFKNVSSHRIKFFVGFKNTSEEFFKLKRIKMPTDKGDEIRSNPIAISWVTLDGDAELWKFLEPKEEFVTSVNLQDLIEKWELKPGTHHLILIFRHEILIVEDKGYRYAKDEKGQIVNWPSEPFTLTLEAPKSPTTEFSK